MIPKPLADIDRSHIHALVENGVPEDRQLEYKSELPSNSEAEKKKFCSDVTAMANSLGGDIVYGVQEGEGEEQGVLVAAKGLSNPNRDQEERRLQQILESGTRPRVPPPEFRWIEGFSVGPVLVMRVQPSWNGPHMVTLASSSPFYARAGARKHPMDVDEIRDAFLAGAGRWRRMERWRTDRVAQIEMDQGPTSILGPGRVILHILPFSALVRSKSVSATDIKSLVHDHFQAVTTWPHGTGQIGRPNVDGWLVDHHTSAGVAAYCQVFRDGSVESVGAGIIVDSSEGTRSRVLCDFEPSVITAVAHHTNGLSKLGFPVPYAVLVTITGAKGAIRMRGMRLLRDHDPIDVELLALPHVLLDRFDTECAIAESLKPAFDVAWNAAGYETCPYYDDEGHWLDPNR